MNYQVCTRTVMDTSDPDITFDSHGVSNWALDYDARYRSTVEKATLGERDPELHDLVDAIKASGRGKKYDCIVGVSGGVDSSYVILSAKRLGLRPLAVHFDSGWNSELAVSNISNLVSKLNIDLFTQVVDWREMKDLQLSFFRASVPNCDIPTDHAFPAVAYEQAARYGVKYILSGSNIATESVLPRAWGYNAQDARHLKAIQRRFGSVKLRSYPLLGIIRRQFWYQGVHGIKVVPLLNYMRYVKDEAKLEIQEELGWRDYGGKHYESVFTRYFQGYYLPTKFGFDKRRAHLSSLILSGQMTRDQAMEELQREPYEEALRLQDHEFVAKKLGITVGELDRMVAEAPVSHMAYPNSSKMYELLLALRRSVRVR